MAVDLAASAGEVCVGVGSASFGVLEGVIPARGTAALQLQSVAD